MFQSGQQIGPYTLISRIGRGGFGEVWLAHRAAKFVTTQVAVKLPLDQQIDHTAIEQEAQLWAQASGHPNVMPIIEASEYSGQIVIVSEYTPDGSLDRIIENHRETLTLSRILELSIGILRGLEYLHSRDIVHRDLKPANVLMQGDTPRLADFGISRAMKVTSTSGTIAGTPWYMAPEAFNGERNVQTDIWSMGVLMYQLLSGVLPFPQTDYSELIGAIVTREPGSLPESVPQALGSVVMKALSKDPSKRFPSATEMRNFLEQERTTWFHPDRPLTPPRRRPMIYFVVLSIPLLLSVLLFASFFKPFSKIVQTDSHSASESSEGRPQPTPELQNSNGDLKQIMNELDLRADSRSCREKKDYDCALQKANELISLGFVSGYDERAKTNQSLGKYSDAIADCTKAIELKAAEGGFYETCGDVYEEVGNFDEAKKNYTVAIKLDPNSRVYFKRGDIYLRKDAAYDEAITDFTRVIELNSDYWPAYVGRGAAFYAKADYSSAVRDYKKALQFDPNDEQLKGLIRDATAKRDSKGQ